MTDRGTLQARRKAINAAIDEVGLAMTKKIIQEYETQMKSVMADAQKCLKPLNLWLPYCDRRLPDFEARIQDDGYVCRFTEQMSGSGYLQTRSLKKGYLVAETVNDLNENWVDPYDD